MPAVVDKARQFSLQRKQSSLRKSYHSGKKHITKLYHHFNFHSIITAHRLVYQAPDMPRSGSEKQAIVTRTKRSSESPEPTQNRDSRTVLIPSRWDTRRLLLTAFLETVKWWITQIPGQERPGERSGPPRSSCLCVSSIRLV